ncbi:MAG: TRAP transporter small permease subunit [Kiloniellaceae bacterium]|nr:TRAP transporter small permease subunit [Kiloniellaceae bacterium]
MCESDRTGERFAQFHMLKTIDRLNDAFGWLAAAAFVAVGAMITYEVVMRYVFLAPTVWAEELSRFLQIWATYIAAAYVLRHRQLIAITLLVNKLGPQGRRVADAFALIWILLFCAVAVFYGLEIMLDSIRQGRASATMLGVPKWMTEAAIPFGFTLLGLQALAELIRLPQNPPPLGGDRGEF